MSKVAVAIGLFIGLMFIMFFVLTFIALKPPSSMREALSESVPSAPTSFIAAKRMIKIESVGPDVVVVRNIGPNLLGTSEIEIYVDDEKKECFWNFQSIAPNAVSVCITDSRCRYEAKAVFRDSKDVIQCSPVPAPPKYPTG